MIKFSVKKFLFFSLVLLISISLSAMQRSKRTRKVSPEVSSSLQEAIEEKNLETLKIALRDGADPSVADEQKNNILHLVCQKGIDKFISPLIDHVNINAKNCDGETALMLAAKNGHAKCVKKLLSLDASVKICNNDGLNACDLAAQNGRLECLESILSEGIVATKDKDNALLLATKNNHELCMNLLLDFGARPNKVIETAIANGDNNCIMPLLMKGANVRDAFICAVMNKNDYLTDLFLGKFENIEDQVKQFLIVSRPIIQDAKEAAFFSASINGNDKIFKKFFSEINDQRLKQISLINTCLFGYFEFVDTLLKSGVNPNFLLEALDLTPLLAAVSRNKSCKIVELLLDFKADPNVANVLGFTPLMSAAIFGCSRCVNFLLREKANPDIINNVSMDTPTRNVLSIFESFDQEMVGATALISAACFSKTDCVKSLLRGGANPNLKNNRGNTAFDVALQKNHSSCVRVLSEYLSQEEKTKALCYAVEQDFVNCVQELLASGAIANDKSLMTAVMLNKTSCLELLLNASASTQIRDLANFNPSLLEFPIFQDNDEILKLLFKFGAKDSINNNFSSLLIAATFDKPNCIETILTEESNLKLSGKQRCRRHLFALKRAIEKNHKNFIFTFLLNVDLANLATKYSERPVSIEEQQRSKTRFIQAFTGLATGYQHTELAEIFSDPIKFDQELDKAARKMRLSKVTTNNDDEREKFCNLAEIIQARRLGINQKRKKWNMKKVIDNGTSRRKRKR